MELTPVQKKVMDFIVTYIENSGIPPTLREIATHFKWKAVGSAQDVVAALRKKGVLVSPSPGKSRQIIPIPSIMNGFFKHDVEISAQEDLPLLMRAKRSNSRIKPSLETVLPGFEDLIRVPFFQKIPPEFFSSLFYQHYEYTTFPPMSRSQLKGGRLFAMIIEGYSMLNAGFLPGDYVLIEESKVANDREIVVALLKNKDTTVKRFAQKGSYLYRSAHKMAQTTVLPPAFLVPENPDFEPTPFGFDESESIVGIVRSLFRKSVL